MNDNPHDPRVTALRPWPASPYQDPITRSQRGPVYLPPQPTENALLAFIARALAWFFLTAALLGGAFLAYSAIEYFFIPGTY